jgi:uncharacterized pyridoxamine 5'-phosphate oxidase family protein
MSGIWNQTVEILSDSSLVGYMATVQDGRPRVRPMGFMFEEDGRLYFCVTTNKDIYEQIAQTPYIEYSKTTKDIVWVRVRGEIKFEEIESDGALVRRQRIFEKHPELKAYLKTTDNPLFKVFYLDSGQIILDDFIQGKRIHNF